MQALYKTNYALSIIKTENIDTYCFITFSYVPCVNCVFLL